MGATIRKHFTLFKAGLFNNRYRTGLMAKKQEIEE